MFKRFIAAWATRRVIADNGKLAARVAELEQQLAAEQSRSRVKDVELAELAAVVARNRERVIAETAIFSKQVAEVEKQ
ncbi:MAG: hypothetical protein JNM18_06285 [Planctomycetaceae bacterium]|nr:hypothetical protein [Planctomycetaceae bacterium]